MRVAISSQDGEDNTPFCARFGRCNAFVLFDTETGDWEVESNPAAAARGGAGAQVVQFLADNGVGVVVSGRYGPTAFAALDAAGIHAFVADGGTPAELFYKFLANELERVDTATGQEMHH